MVTEATGASPGHPDNTPIRLGEYERVASIDGPGRYSISRNPTLGYQEGTLGGYIPLHSSEIDYYLVNCFPQTQGVIFVPARIDDATETAIPSRWVRKPWERSRGHIEVDGEQYEVDFYGNSSNGYGDQHFSIEDVALSKQNNQLVVGRSAERDGKVRIAFDGAVHHYHRQTSGWKGSVEVAGEKPGKMVQGVIDKLNAFIAESGFPLWKSTKLAK